MSALHDVEDQVQLLLHVLHPPVHDGLLLLDVLHVLTNGLQRCLGIPLVSFSLRNYLIENERQLLLFTCLLTISSLAAFTIVSFR